MKAGIIFDLDGTLVDSLPGIARGLNLALASIGYDTHNEESIRRMVGRGARDLCRSALCSRFNTNPADVPESAIQQLLAAFMREYPNAWQSGTHIYPGIDEMLRWIAGTVPLAVLSNKPHIITEPLVKHTFPVIPFDPVMGYSDRFPRKPNPASLLHIAAQWGLEAGQITLVGDSIHDALTADNAGCSFIAVGWGYGNLEEIKARGCAICHSAAALTNHLAPLLPPTA